MSDLADFLLARIAEDEAVAKGATPSPWLWHPAGTSDFSDADAQHVIRWDPARVLAECEAKRRIVEMWQATAATRAAWGGMAYSGADEQCQHETLGEVLDLLALPYADHPDYREKWRP